MLISSKKFFKNIQTIAIDLLRTKQFNKMAISIYQKKLRAYNDIFALLTSNVILTVEQENYLKEYLFILSENLHNDLDLTNTFLDFEIWFQKQLILELI
jgi:hypothetical protein